VTLSAILCEDNEDEDSCLSSPCGENARCKNIEGVGRFLCTCDPQSEYYYGNPYNKCVRCERDSHCQMEGQLCLENQ